MRSSRKTSASAFTLVELIVVITILAILATVGFLALQGYTKDAKDTAVKTNLKTAVDAVSLESATDGSSPRKYVIHDGARSISGTVLLGTALSPGAFWTAGTNYSAGTPDYAKLKLNGTNMVDANGAPFLFGAADLSEKLATGRTRIRSFFQIAADLGDSGVSVDGTYPTGDATSSGGLIASSSGSSTPLVASSAGSAPSASGGGGGGGGPAPTRYPGCDTDNIVLANGQHWAACNAGASNAYTAEAITNCGGALTDCNTGLRNVLGELYQWGRNDPVTDGAITATLAPSVDANNSVGHTDFIRGGGANLDWAAVSNPNFWGGNGATESVWTFASLGSQASMKGPCGTGYHVPTPKEWVDAIVFINGTVSTTGGLQPDTDVRTTLRLPLAGYRVKNAGDFQNNGSYGNYWASSMFDAGNAYNIRINTTDINPKYDYRRAQALSVRCIRD